MSYTELEQQNRDLKFEADRILQDFGLMSVLSKYGRPIVQGSYQLDLMTWRDLDIYLECSELSVARHFELGGEIGTCLQPLRMVFRNEILTKRTGLPEGLYWGIYTSNQLPDLWKIDIWSIDIGQVEHYVRFQDDLRVKLNPENRQVILAIKNQICRHPQYRKQVTSLDVYKAVIGEEVSSLEEFIARFPVLSSGI